MAFLSERLWLAGSALAILASTPAAAQTVTAAEPQSVIAAMEASGLEAVLESPSDSSAHIRSAHDGVKFIVLFYNCDDDGTNCRTLQFYMGYNDAKSTTLERINEWNMTRRFTRAYRDESSDPVMEMDVDTDLGGVSRQWFQEQISTWRSQMDAFHAHIFPEAGAQE